MAKTPYTNFLGDASRPVPQSAPASDNQVPNAAGGYTFVVSDVNRLERFLILGTVGGTYYATEKDLTKDNVEFLVKFLKEDPNAYITTLVNVSQTGRAYRNSPAIFALALVFKHGTAEDKQLARVAFNQVIRTSTHLFEWAGYMEQLGGWSASRRKAAATWYQSKNPDSLAYQAVKYRQRDGWTHRDLFRLVHPKGVDTSVGNFILGKEHNGAEAPTVIRGFQLAQSAKDVRDVLDVLEQNNNLPWEALPTQFLREPDVWKKLFYNGQLEGQALLRNITRLARIGAFQDLKFAADYAAKLTDSEMIARTRLHPVQYLNALVVHTDGQIDRKRTHGWGIFRNKDWETSPIIRDALDKGFYLAFKTIEPANKRTLIGLDVSGSMGAQAAVGSDLTAAQAGAAMAMVTARTEPMYAVYGFSHEFRNLGISASDSLSDVLRKTERMSYGATDMSLPMQFAQQRNMQIDTFLVITDNETWYGNVHPHVALNNYRAALNIPAKLVVMGVSATQSTIGDVDDPGTLDVVGFDANAPKVVADFSAGRV